MSPDVSFDYVAGGQESLCGVRSGGYSLLCFDSDFDSKRIYYNNTTILQDLNMGDDQICALTNGTQNVKCWRNAGDSPNETEQFQSISSGIGISCGVSMNSSRVICWGTNLTISNFIQSQFENETMWNIAVGANHACGLNINGVLICKGNNNFGQITVPSNSPYQYFQLALGDSYTCATLRSNGTVICWGGNGDYSSESTNGVFFETIVAGLNFTCGLTTNNFSIICWGPGWRSNFSQISLPKILPGPCVQMLCSGCGIYPESQTLCSGSKVICKPCDIPIKLSPPVPPIANNQTSLSRSNSLTGGLLAFAIVGSIGAFSGFCTLIYCFWAGVCFGKKKIHNSVQPTTNNRSNSNSRQVFDESPPSRFSSIRRQGSRLVRRQRSGTSSKNNDRSEEFSFFDLVAATNNFSLENKIGAGSFGVVYRGKLWDGREVAIKRGETGTKVKKFQEKESAFESELAFLSRLHHKHLVRLIGFCEERDERLLVYEYMKNGALFNHLHDKNNTEKSSSVINSWKMRIKISLDAARGIEYLHNYAVPPIIHRDIKSSNILLDSNWTARVSDFGLSLMGPNSGPAQDLRPTKAVGTVGYIDPEYYGLNVLTSKSDIYGLGVVLLELLTGKRAIFKGGENGGEVVSVVDFAAPAIVAGDIGRILDKRVGPPVEEREAEAVELVGYTAVSCVNLEGKDRPSISNVVVNLERALGLCDYSHGEISSGEISIVTH